MSIDLIAGSAGRADAWVRQQSARIEQRHLQSGRHCRLDLAGLLQRVAPAPVRSPSGIAVPTSPTCHRVQGPATLGDFVARHRAAAAAPREWIATLADRTTVVVSDCCGAPNAVQIEKAVSIVQSRAYLEARARQLLRPFTKEDGTWRLVTIDFGVTARRHGCEFLMSFAFRATNGGRSITSPSVEIGFALASPAAIDPIFVLTVVTATGFSA
jgi:hypothetical protein